MSGNRRPLPSLGLSVIGLAWALLWLPASPAGATPPGNDARRLTDGAAAILEVHIDEAAELLEPLMTRYPTDGEVLEQYGWLEFHRGAYGNAVRRMEASLAAIPATRSAATRTQRESALALFATTVETTSGYVEQWSEDGRFVIRHAPGRDAVLVPYALDALARADEAVSRILGSRVPGPVRLEIYPSASALADISPLTAEEIARTGTIALSKWNRLMIASPRALRHGYPWLDTITHEHTHLVLSHGSRNRAPVWLQEGIAKLLEHRWRGSERYDGPIDAALDPSSRALLLGAVEEDRLLPFARLHPSIAQLPSQEDAALAFAQVATFMRRYAREGADDALAEVTARLAEGHDAQAALADVAGVPFPSLVERWRRELRTTASAATRSPSPRRGRQPTRLLPRRLASNDPRRDARAEVEEADGPEARRHLRLGDLLWERSRYGAALAEYERALRHVPGDPVTSTRLAHAALRAGQPTRARTALEPLAAEYPEYAPLIAMLGAAMVGEGAAARAVPILRDSLALNPFDPQPHCDLAQVAPGASERQREARACALLSAP